MATKAIAAALMALGLLGGSPAVAQSTLGGIFTTVPGAQQPRQAQAATTEPAATGAYIGLRGEPGQQKGVKGLLITEIDPGSPAETAGLQAGDVLLYLVWTQGPRDAYLKRPQIYAASQAAVDGWLERQTPGRQVKAQWIHNGRGQLKDLTLAAVPGGSSAADTAAISADSVEAARTAYLQMCGKGQEKLSAATCDSMRRDLDAAVAARAAATREAEVMGVYRQLCSPASRKLSEETCASMLAEAKRTLAAGAPPPPARAKKAAGPSATQALKSTYDELCAPGAAQVSAQTCAALKAEAGPGPRKK